MTDLRPICAVCPPGLPAWSHGLRGPFDRARSVNERTAVEVVVMWRRFDVVDVV